MRAVFLRHLQGASTASSLSASGQRRETISLKLEATCIGYHKLKQVEQDLRNRASNDQHGHLLRDRRDLPARKRGLADRSALGSA
jgi:hypothetical protein